MLVDLGKKVWGFGLGIKGFMPVRARTLGLHRVYSTGFWVSCLLVHGLLVVMSTGRASDFKILCRGSISERHTPGFLTRIARLYLAFRV
jgi:hypothetical protein